MLANLVCPPASPGDNDFASSIKSDEEPQCCDAVCDVKCWRLSTSSSTTSACESGRMGPAVGAIDLRHALYRQVLYEGLGTVRRRQLHRRIGPAWRRGMARRRGRSRPSWPSTSSVGVRCLRAVHYWQQAGDNAARRHAHHDAIAALRERIGVARDPAREPRAHPARARTAARPGGSAEGHEGGGGPGCGRGLHPGLYPVPADGGDACCSPGSSGGSRSFR